MEQKSDGDVDGMCKRGLILVFRHDPHSVRSDYFV